MTLRRSRFCAMLITCEVISKVQREHGFYCLGRVDFDFLAINHTRGYVNELKNKKCRPKSKICSVEFWNYRLYNKR